MTWFDKFSMQGKCFRPPHTHSCCSCVYLQRPHTISVTNSACLPSLSMQSASCGSCLLLLCITPILLLIWWTPGNVRCLWFESVECNCMVPVQYQWSADHWYSFVNNLSVMISLVMLTDTRWKHESITMWKKQGLCKA